MILPIAQLSVISPWFLDSVDDFFLNEKNCKCLLKYWLSFVLSGSMSTQPICIKPKSKQRTFPEFLLKCNYLLSLTTPLVYNLLQFVNLINHLSTCSLCEFIELRILQNKLYSCQYNTLFKYISFEKVFCRLFQSI